MREMAGTRGFRAGRLGMDSTGMAQWAVRRELCSGHPLADRARLVPCPLGRRSGEVQKNGNFQRRPLRPSLG